MAEEQYRDLLRRVQQKAESYREQQQQAAEFQSELEAVKDLLLLQQQLQKKQRQFACLNSCPK